MNKQERQILHGLYFHRELIGEKLQYEANEILWLADNAIPKTRQWQRDGKLQSLPSATEDYLRARGAVSADSTRHVSYLANADYIDLERKDGMFRIGVTVTGADLARQLDSRFGRLNYWYAGHKNGVVGLLVTVLVSIVAAALTAFVVSSD